MASAGAWAMLCWLPAFAPHAAETATATVCSRPLTIAASPIGRTMMISTSGEVTGVARDFFERVSSISGCKLDYVVVPRARGHYLFSLGAIDLMPAVTQAPERDALGDFIQTHQVRAMLVSMREREMGRTTMEDIKNGVATIDTIRGYQFGPAYAALLKQPAFQTRQDNSPDPETMVRKLSAGRSGAALIFPIALIEAADRAGVTERLRVVELEGISPVPAGIYLSHRLAPSDHLIIKRAILSVVNSGEFENIYRSYYREPKWALDGMDFIQNKEGGKRK